VDSADEHRAACEHLHKLLRPILDDAINLGIKVRISVLIWILMTTPGVKKHLEIVIVAMRNWVYEDSNT